MLCIVVLLVPVNHFNKKDVVSVVTCKNYESQAYPLLLLRYQSSSDSLVVLYVCYQWGFLLLKFYILLDIVCLPFWFLWFFIFFHEWNNFLIPFDMDIPNLITYLTECISAAFINKFCICDLITVYVSKYKYMYLETTFYFLCRYIHVILTLESSNFVKIVSNFLQCFFLLLFFSPHLSFVSVTATPFSSLFLVLLLSQII